VDTFEGVVYIVHVVLKHGNKKEMIIAQITNMDYIDTMVGRALQCGQGTRQGKRS